MKKILLTTVLVLACTQSQARAEDLSSTLTNALSNILNNYTQNTATTGQNYYANSANSSNNNYATSTPVQSTYSAPPVTQVVAPYVNQYGQYQPNPEYPYQNQPYQSAYVYHPSYRYNTPPKLPVQIDKTNTSEVSNRDPAYEKFRQVHPHYPSPMNPYYNDYVKAMDTYYVQQAKIQQQQIQQNQTSPQQVTAQVDPQQIQQKDTSNYNPYPQYYNTYNDYNSNK